MTRRRGYGALLTAGLRTALTYRAALLLTAVTTALSLAVQLSVWRAVFAGKADIAGYDVTTMTTYLVVGNLLAVLLANQIDDNLAGDVYRGDHVVAMVRPVSFLGTHALLAIPAVGVRLVLVVAPLLVLAVVAVPVSVPTLAGLAAFVVSAVFAAALAVLLNLLVGMAGFITTSTWGLRYLKSTIIAFASGQLVPLDLLPPAAGAVLTSLPFAGMVHTPVRLLIGMETGLDALALVGVQAAWLVAGVIGCRLAWGAAVERGEVSGG